MWTVPPARVSPEATPSSLPRPKPAAAARELGFWTAVALVVGNMIGSGVFLLPASLAGYGGLSLPGWIISATGSAVTTGLRS